MEEFIEIISDLRKKTSLERHGWKSSHVGAENQLMKQNRVVKELSRPRALYKLDQLVSGPGCIKDLVGSKVDRLEMGITCQ